MFTKEAFKKWFKTLPDDFVFTDKPGRISVSQYCPLGKFAYQCDPKGNWKATSSGFYQNNYEILQLPWIKDYVISFDKQRFKFLSEYRKVKVIDLRQNYPALFP